MASAELSDLPEDLRKQAAVTAHLNRYIWVTTIKPLIGDDLIAEHKAHPIGKHTPALDMVLQFLRSDLLPDQPRLVVVIVTPERAWAIGEHSRRVGTPIRVRPLLYDSVLEIEHAIFLERLAAAELTFG